MGLFGKKSLQDESQLVISKKRKNAVVEVYRFVCQQEFPVDMKASVYDKAYNMLINGDVKGAVKHLTWEKKHKLAMFVAQSVNSNAIKTLNTHQQAGMQ